MISVIISTYNENLDWIKEAIDSIRNQTYGDLEIIIVLDNPNNLEIEMLINEYARIDERIVVIKNSINLGIANALNAGINVAKGDMIARMDADDISLPNRLVTEKEFLDEHQEYSFVGCDALYIDETGEVINIRDNFVVNESHIIEQLKQRNVFKHPTMMFRSSVLKSVGGYLDLNPAQDYELITRMITCGYRGVNLDKKLLKYRIRDNSISSSKALLQMINADYISQNYRKGTLCNLDEYKRFKQAKLATEKHFECSQKYYLKAINSRKTGKKTLKDYYIYLFIACLLSKYRRKSILRFDIDFYKLLQFPRLSQY